MLKAVMYGAGNIGRGFIGQLLSQSGYEVVFIDVNQSVVTQLNRDHAYPINIVSETGNSEIMIKNVSAVDARDGDAVAKAISEADLMATAVGVNVLPLIARPIAGGLSRRWHNGNHNPLNIIICENLLDANKFLKKLISAELSERERSELETEVGFVEASVGRMVPVMTPEMQAGNILRVCVEPYCELPVDLDGFRGIVPEIKNMIPASPFAFFIQRKLYIHNMGHALIAYLGRLKGYEYIWEACLDEDIEYVCRSAMYAAAMALAREHGMDYPDIKQYAEDLLFRFRNRQLGDTVERVGREIIRKLSPDDRLIGAFNLCIRTKVDPSSIVIGTQAALACAREIDPELLTLVENSEVDHNIFKNCLEKRISIKPMPAAGQR